MEQNNENVSLGKIIDESSYMREDKHINIDNVINIDFNKQTDRILAVVQQGEHLSRKLLINSLMKSNV